MGKKKPQIPVADYHMTIHAGFCHGPIDILHKLYFDKKEGWFGRLIDNAVFSISQPNLFGGPKKEGGVRGQVSLYLGGATQVLSDFIAGKMGKTAATCPAYRGVTTAFFTEEEGSSRKGFYWRSNQPYLPDVWAKITRIPSAWYPEKAWINSCGADTRRSIYISLDRSISMGLSNKLDTVKQAMSLLFDRLEAGIEAYGLDIDIAVRFYSGPLAGASDELQLEMQSYTHVTLSQLDALRAFVGDSSYVNTASTSLSWAVINPAPPSATPIPRDWFEDSLADETVGRRVFIVVGDTGVGHTSTLDTEREALTAMGVEMSAFSMDAGDLIPFAALDNTPDDAVPVIEDGDFESLFIAIDRALFLDDENPDANPSHIIHDCLTNTEWGMGHPSSALDLNSFQYAADTFYNELFGLSMMWSQQTSIENFVQEVIDHVEATLFVNPATGLITIKPIRNDYDAETLPVLDDTNCVISNFQRKAWADTINEIVVKWTNPQTEEEEGAPPGQDLANIVMQGGIVSQTRSFYGIRCRSLATRVAQQRVRVSAAPLATADLEVDRTAWDFVPGGVLKLRNPEHGVDEIIMRIANIDYGKPGQPTIKMQVAEDVFSLEPATTIEPDAGLWEDPSEEPSEVDEAKVFTLPYFLAANRVSPIALEDVAYPDVFAGVLAAQDGGDTVEVDLYGDSVDAAGNAVSGVLATLNLTSLSSLQAAIDAEIETTLAWDAFDDITQGDGPEVGGLVMFDKVDGTGSEAEVELALISAYDSGTGTWTLQRGVLDTVPRPWPVGATVRFISAGRIHDNTVRAAEETVEYRLLPRTSLGTLAVNQAPVVSHTMTERPHLPSRPADVKIEGTGFGIAEISGDPSEVNVTWANRNRLTEDSQILSWDDATVTPEDGQTTTIVVMDPDRNVITVHDSLAGAGYAVPRASFGGFAEGSLSLSSARDGYESLQAFELAFVFLPAPDGALLLSGDAQSGTDSLAPSGDEQSGSDKIQTSILGV